MTRASVTRLEPSERSVGEVLADIGQNLERLVRAEARLAMAGAFDVVRSTAVGAALVAVGALLGLLATGLFLWGAVALLSATMKPWEAMLLVAGGAGLLAAAVVVVGIKALRVPAGNP